MNPRDLLTIALNQDISILVRVDAVGPQYQLGYMAGMRRAIEVIEQHQRESQHNPYDAPWKWLFPQPSAPPADDGTGC